MLHVPAQFDQFADLRKGLPLQLRTIIEQDRLMTLKKGTPVHVECKGSLIKAVLISEPLVVVSRPEAGEEEISLEVIKSY